MINTVKIQANGYLVDGTMSVPNEPSNRHYQEIQEWIAQGNTPEPEFTDAELLDKAKQQAKERVKNGFITDSNLPVTVNVTDLLTTTTADYNFVGGYESAQMLDGKRKLIQESFALGLITTDDVDFRLVDGSKILVSMADATNIVLSIANAYEVQFSKYKDLKLQIVNATTAAELDVVVW